jgi:Icc-related predicted phosphoesterase
VIAPQPPHFSPPTGSPSPRNLWIFAILLVLAFTPLILMIQQSSQLQLLNDPFLQRPTENSVEVVWFTEFPGSQHLVSYGENLKQKVIANTIPLSRVREDQKSWVGNQPGDGTVYSQPTVRKIWRHAANITNLSAGVRLPYQVTSFTTTGEKINSKVFSLSAKPQPGTPLKILLTSDHQLKPMVAANLQKVAETFKQIDGIFFAGDLVNVPDRASEWFDDNRGNAFFPCLQGHGNYQFEYDSQKTVYRGAELIQNAPLFPVIGNHEVMGMFSSEKNLSEQFSNPYPREAAEALYQQQQAQINPSNDSTIRQQWLKNHTFNTDTVEEIFSFPGDGKPYYAVTFGDVRLVSLYITNLWRIPKIDPEIKGRYQERDRDFDTPENWGYGQQIFEPIAKGSEQYNWLQQELQSLEFQQAKYKVVMFHHPPHSLGDNIVPAYTNPVQIIERDEAGKIQKIRYEYPKDQDYIIRDVMPLLEAAGVQLVYFGHCHLWNRFIGASGMHFLESSNVGNSYGAAYKKARNFIPSGFTEDYVALGDPNGLEPVIPTLKPLSDATGKPLPYLTSNEITAFSILDTEKGTVSSYYFDTRQPDSAVVQFDEFHLGIND